MNQADALTLLRSSVTQFDRSERLALATLLTVQCNPRFREVTHEADPPFAGTLDDTLLASGDFPQTVKLAFAIELLQYQLSQDEEGEGEGLFESNDYEGEDYYSSDKPLLLDETDSYSLDDTDLYPEYSEYYETHTRTDMTQQPIRPFPRDFEGPLLNLDTDDLNLEDRTILGQIAMLAQQLNLHEKLALTINAHWSIDTSHRQLVELKPKYGSYGPNLAAAVKLTQHLSAAAKTRLIIDFLCDEWETEGHEGEEKLTGGYNFCPRCNQQTWHELEGDSLRCSACLNTENNFSSSMS